MNSPSLDHPGNQATLLRLRPPHLRGNQTRKRSTLHCSCFETSGRPPQVSFPFSLLFLLGTWFLFIVVVVVVIAASWLARFIFYDFEIVLRRASFGFRLGFVIDDFPALIVIFLVVVAGAPLGHGMLPGINELPCNKL